MASEDQAAVEAVVRRYVEAPARGEDPTALVAGPLRVREEARYLSRLRDPLTEYGGAVEELEVERLDGDEAVVRLVASRSWRSQAADEAGTSALAGPVLLSREGGEWLIVALPWNGYGLPESLYRSPVRELTVGPVRLAASCELGEAGCEIAVVVENGGDRAVRAAVLVTALEGFWKEHREPPEWLGEIAPGERSGDALMWQTGVPLRVTVDVDVEGGEQPVRHRFEFGPPEVVPWRQRWAMGELWAKQLCLAALLVAISVWTFGMAGVGIGLVAVGLIDALMAWVGRDRSRRTRAQTLLCRAAAVIGVVIIVAVASTKSAPLRSAAIDLAFAVSLAVVPLLLWLLRQRRRP